MTQTGKDFASIAFWGIFPNSGLAQDKSSYSKKTKSFLLAGCGFVSLTSGRVRKQTNQTSNENKLRWKWYGDGGIRSLVESAKREGESAGDFLHDNGASLAGV